MTILRFLLNFDIISKIGSTLLFMKTVKFLLLGITGDLSKRKILPALAQLAENNKENNIVDLIGYSRSIPDLKRLHLILDKNSKDTFHSVSTVRHVRGEYDDNTEFNSLISNLNEPEEVFIAYLAVPPKVIINFLLNSCPYHSKKFYLIIEKPFGQNREEANKILNILDACDLGKQIHFFDHYLFKNSILKGKKYFRHHPEIFDKPIKSISISALESIGVSNRIGYYEITGAFKDMSPHLFSLLFLVFELAGLQLDVSKMSPDSLKLGQYEEYCKELGLKSSTTETYFAVSLNYDLKREPLVINLSSGKKLEKKKTTINVEFIDGSKLIWDVDPEGRVRLFDDRGTLTVDHEIPGKECLEHAIMFERIIEGRSLDFVEPDQILRGWEIYQKVMNYKKEKQIGIKKY